MDDRATREDFAELTAEIRSLGRLLAATAQDSGGERQGGHATITVNAGGVALWVAVMCAVVCLIAVLAASAMFVNLDRKVDRAIDYQQANYRNAK